MNLSKVNPVRRSGSLDLYLIDLPLDLKGFRRFLNSWLVIDRISDMIILIDTGPASTISSLERSLSSLGVEKIDYLLLTHVHLDHGGGAGHFMERYPHTSIIVSPRGARHIMDPGRLWEGSLKTLGSKAEAYGKPIPVSALNLMSPEEVSTLPFEIMDTPGHASHHLSCRYRNILFAGEAAGVHLPMEGGSGVYLRPATPPPFRMDTSLASLDMLMEKTADIICYCHYGFSEEPSRMLNLHRSQLLLWEQEIGSKLKKKKLWQRSDEGNFIQSCLEMLLEKDPLLKTFDLLGDDERKRETFFLKNSIKGFTDYLSQKAF